MKRKVLLYGANGFSGKLILKEAQKQGVELVIAGRNKKEIKKASDEFNFPYRIASLDNDLEINDMLKDIDCLFNAAGPFSQTTKPLIKACIAMGIHYVDLSGEIDDYIAVHSHNKTAIENNVMLLPGVGFDIVPTDCLGLYTSKKIKDPSELNFYIKGFDDISSGTATTAIEAIGKGIRFRKDGKIVRAKKTETVKINYNEKNEAYLLSTWGDIFTSYLTTKIKNIKVYFKSSLFNKSYILLLHYLESIYKYNFMKKPLFFWASMQKGPSQEKMDTGTIEIIAEAKNSLGESAATHLVLPEGYIFTALSSVMIIKKIQDGIIKPGFHTPAQLFGEDFILEVEGTSRSDL